MYAARDQRFWSSGMTEDKRAAFSTLFAVLQKLCQLMAPYTPFVTDDIYFNLMGESVHLADYPQPDESLINERLEQEMAAVLQIVEQTRSLRNDVGMKTKQPLAKLIVIPKEEEFPLAHLQQYSSIIREEVNIKEVEFRENAEDLFQLDLKLNFAVAGPKFGKAVSEIKNKLVALKGQDKDQFLKSQEIQLSLQSGETVTLTLDDVKIEKKGKDGYQLAEGNNFLTLLDINLTQELKEEGLVREFIRAVQTYRKELNLPVDLRVDLFIQVDPKIQQILMRFHEFLHKNLILQGVYFEDKQEMRTFEVEGNEMKLFIHSSSIED